MHIKYFNYPHLHLQDTVHQIPMQYTISHFREKYLLLFWEVCASDTCSINHLLTYLLTSLTSATIALKDRNASNTWKKNEHSKLWPESQINSILSRDDADVFRSQLPDAILSQHIINLIDDLHAAVTPLVNVVKQPNRQILSTQNNCCGTSVHCPHAIAAVTMPVH